MLPLLTLFTYSAGTGPVKRLLFRNSVSAPAKIAGISPVRLLWLKSTTDPAPNITGIMESDDGGGTTPEKEFRWRRREEREGCEKREKGMGPLNRFTLKSRYTNSDRESSPLRRGPHSEFSESDRYRIDDGNAGRVPFNLLDFKSRWRRGDEMSVGISPENWFDDRIRILSSGSLVSVAGIIPESWLWLMSRVWRWRRAERVAGIAPVRRLLVKERTRRFRRRPSCGGIGPVTMPGKRMSWVSSERSEMAGGRDPASPGESERPVPRERIVTRPRSQTTPVNEQGSEEEKSQVEKNPAPEGLRRRGISVRLFLMAFRAWRSAAAMLAWN